MAPWILPINPYNTGNLKISDTWNLKASNIILHCFLSWVTMLRYIIELGSLHTSINYSINNMYWLPTMCQMRTSIRNLVVNKIDMTPSCMVLWSSLEYVDYLGLNTYYMDKPKLNMSHKLVIYNCFSCFKYLWFSKYMTLIRV